MSIAADIVRFMKDGKEYHDNKAIKYAEEVAEDYYCI